MTAEFGASTQLYDRAKRVLPGGSSRSTLQPCAERAYAARGHGCRLVDVDGRELLDAQNNFTALAHGHGQPDVIAAAQQTISALTSVGLPTEAEVEFAEYLQGRLGDGRHWRFCCSGSEAVMFAIRLARKITKRDKIIRFGGAYHGSHDAVMSGTPGVVSENERTTAVLPFNDIEALRREMSGTGRDVAAVIFDALPNRAGLRPATAEFAYQVRELTRRYDALLIQDEIVTFRCEVAGLHKRYGISPDIVTLGKIIGGGFPIGAFGGRPELMAHFDSDTPETLEQSGTFAAHPVSMSAGLVATRLWSEEQVTRLNDSGSYVRAVLAEQGWLVTGDASLFRLHVEEPKRLWVSAYGAGLLLAPNGLGCLSTAMQEADIEEIVRVLGQFDPNEFNTH